MNRAFSLVELSIVLVILGLLTGGVLTGQSLIHASRLRAVTVQHSEFRSAVLAFRDKYMAVPGDMSNATLFWSKDNAACSGHSGAAGTPGTCNGNGNGIIDNDFTYGVTNEGAQFWRHLVLSGLISGSYAGVNASTCNSMTPGTNIPASKLYPSAGYAVIHHSNTSGLNTGLYRRYFGNFIMMGSPHYSCVNYGFLWGNAISAIDAYNIDMKIDDGIPFSGYMLADGNAYGATGNYADCLFPDSSVVVTNPSPSDVRGYRVDLGQSSGCRTYVSLN